MSTSTTDDTTAGSTTGTTDDTSSDTSPPPCDEDPVCGLDETVETCPEQCNDCGDGVRYDVEECDNGNANQDYWPMLPPADACSTNCSTTVLFCGDGIPSDGEACDNGKNSEPLYGPTIPTNPSPCTNICTVPRFCGDTIPDAADGEACDDGNNDDGDGCSADCKSTERKVFVTSKAFRGNLGPPVNNLKGLALADAQCQALADANDLKATFKAWLSDSTGSPATRFDTNFTGLYRLIAPGYLIVADGWTGLTESPLINPIDVDETGSPASDQIVWTNSNPDGNSASDLHCNTWSSIMPADTSTVGFSSTTDAGWTSLGAGQFCASSYRLYCFEDPVQ